MRARSLSLLPLFALLTVVADPYDRAARKEPIGSDFQKLIPAQVGSFKRISFQAPAPGLDGEAVYRHGKKEVFMLFSKADNREDLKENLKTIVREIEPEKTTEAREISMKGAVAYIHFIGPTIAFYAWTRGLYCFSVDSKGGDKKVLQEFMEGFPH